MYLFSSFLSYPTVYLFIVVDYPGTVVNENGQRILSDFAQRHTLVPDKWMIIPGELPIEYDPILSDTLCRFPCTDMENHFAEFKELVRSQAEPDSSWYTLTSHIIKKYGTIIMIV